MDMDMDMDTHILIVDNVQTHIRLQKRNNNMYRQIVRIASSAGVAAKNKNTTQTRAN